MGGIRLKGTMELGGSLLSQAGTGLLEAEAGKTSTDPFPTPSQLPQDQPSARRTPGKQTPRGASHQFHLAFPLGPYARRVTSVLCRPPGLIKAF